MSRSRWLVVGGLVTARSPWLLLWLGILVAALPSVAHAQIVNVQGALAKPPAKDGLAGQVELKLDWRGGNNRLFDVGASGSVLGRYGRVVGLAIARGEYGRSPGLTYKRKTFEHARARITLDCRWKWEVFAQHELDLFRRLTVRALTGTGPALQLVDRERISLLAGAAYMVEYERFDRRPDVTDAGARAVSHRASVYVTGIQKLSESAGLAQTVYVQPRIDDPQDLRVLGELSITTKLSKHVALSDALTVAYDRTPPEGIRRYDTQLRVSVLISF